MSKTIDTQSSGNPVGEAENIYPGETGPKIKWADTVADLRLLEGGTKTDDLGSVILKGFATPGDGGGGLFVWDANTTNVEDGGTVFIQATGSVTVGDPPAINAGANDEALAVPEVPATAGRAWRRVYDGPINVKWFGAVGKYPADDTAAFKNAIVSLSRNGTKQRVIEVPVGNYSIKQTLELPDNVWLKGVHYTECLLIFNVPASETRPWGDGILCEGGRQKISDLWIINRNSANLEGRGIDLTATIGGPAIVERCSFDGWRQQLVFDGYEQSVCRDCSFSCDGGVGKHIDNVHIRFAAPHGRNNGTGQNTNVIKIENCNFFSNGGVFLWHEDGITHTCEFLNFNAHFSVACAKFTRVINVHYSHCQSEGHMTLFLIDKASASVAAQNLTITNCEFNIPNNAPVVHLTTRTVVWGLYVYNNEFLGIGSAAGVFKLDGYMDKGYQFGPNTIPNATKIFNGIPSSSYGIVWQPGRLGLGTVNANGSSLEIQESASLSGKALLSKHADKEHWWIGVQGRAMQWKRHTTGLNHDMPNGETVYQEYLTLGANAAPVMPFANATHYPLMSGLHTPDDVMHIYEMEAIARTTSGSGYYHRRQRLAIVQGTNGVFSIGGLSSYPDEFEKAVGPGWRPLAGTGSPPAPGTTYMEASGGQIVLAVQSNTYVTGVPVITRWYIKVRIISRANQ